MSRTTCTVVVNDYADYSIWEVRRGKVPLGWYEVGVTGTKKECLPFVEQRFEAAKREQAWIVQFRCDATSTAGSAGGSTNAMGSDPDLRRLARNVRW